MITRDDISSFHVTMIMHCKKCLAERPAGISPKDWARQSFGYFDKPDDPGMYLQLWCDRHQCNITTIYIPTSNWSHSDGVPLRIEGAEDKNPKPSEDSNELHP